MFMYMYMYLPSSFSPSPLPPFLSLSLSPSLPPLFPSSCCHNMDRLGNELHHIQILQVRGYKPNVTTRRFFHGCGSQSACHN